MIVKLDKKTFETTTQLSHCVHNVWLIKWGRFYYKTFIQLASVGTCVISKHHPLPTRALPGILSTARSRKEALRIRKEYYSFRDHSLSCPIFYSDPSVVGKPCQDWLEILNWTCFAAYFWKCQILQTFGTSSLWNAAWLCFWAKGRRNPEACCALDAFTAKCFPLERCKNSLHKQMEYIYGIRLLMVPGWL